MDIFNAEEIFWTSDPHFYHKSIIKYANRPFSTVEKMNETLIKNWNQKVPKSAKIFILGDLAFTSNVKTIADLLAQLHGEKHLILGNHCYQNRFDRDSIRALFTTTSDLKEIGVREPDGFIQHIVNCHYPMITWNRKLRGAWNLFGHIHSGPNTHEENKKFPFGIMQKDVGVDANNMTPVSYWDIRDKMIQHFMHEQDYSEYRTALNDRNVKEIDAPPLKHYQV